MYRIKLIKQHDEKDCGAACLSMILEAHGRKLTISKIREDIQVDQHGATIRGIIEGAQKNGLICKGFETSSEDVWDYFQSEADYPLMIRIVNHNNYEHYIVVEKYRKSYIYVADPDLGKYKMNYALFSKCYLGQVLIFSKTPDFKKENLRKESYYRFVRLAFQQKKLFIGVAIISLIITAIGIASSFLFQILIDDVLIDITNQAHINEGIQIFASTIVTVGILYIIRMIIQFLRGLLTTKLSKRINLPLMLGYSNHITDLPMKFFETKKTGELLSRFSDASTIQEAISTTILTLLMDVVMVVGCSLLLLKYSAKLFIVAICIFILYFLISYLYLKPLGKLNRRKLEENAQLSSYMKESIDGAETVKACRGEKQTKEKTSSLYNTLIKLSIRESLTGLSESSIIELLTSVGMLVILWIGAMDVINGTLSIGQLMTYFTLVNYFLDPVQNLVSLQQTVQNAIIAADRLNDIMDAEKESTDGISLSKFPESIQFNDVSFRYGTRALVLDKVNFSATSGQTICFIGKSGCGKSTIAKLMISMYVPESGSILVDDCDISKLSLEWIRNNIIYVPQKPFLFTDTIINNLYFGLREEYKISENKLSSLLNDFGCDFVEEMPLGFNSMLEENGTNLSGGQVQRLAIVRAVLRKPRILVLDESTSALDFENEKLIYEKLRSYNPEMILIIITHRVNCIKDADKVYTIQDGKAYLSNEG